MLATAPLFLFPYCCGDDVATVLVWLSPLAALWVLLEPSRRTDEMLHDARSRVVRAMLFDPLFWVMLLIVVIAGLRWANGGIELAYDPEKSEWFVSEASMKFMPASVLGCGKLPFAASLALLVILQGCRHALGKSARASFLLSASTLAGVAGVAAAVAVYFGHSGAVAATKCGLSESSFAGSAFGAYFLAGFAALVAAFENRWTRQFGLFAFALGGTATGVYFFAPAPVSALYLASGIVMLAVCVGYAGFFLGGTTPFKCVATVLIAAAIPCLLAAGLAPEGMNADRLAAFSDEGGSLFRDGFFKLRELLSGMASKAWGERPWIGKGIGSFPLDVRFAATPEQWKLLPATVDGTLNGYWLLLAERGIVGAVSIALPLGFVAFTFVRRLVGAIREAVGVPAASELGATVERRRIFIPACALGPLVVAAVAVETAFDSSGLRADAIMAAGALFALSASSFPSAKKTPEVAAK